MILNNRNSPRNIESKYEVLLFIITLALFSVNRPILCEKWPLYSEKRAFLVQGMILKAFFSEPKKFV